MKRMSLADRFWSKVDIGGPADCWPWKRSKYPSGHGQFHLRGRPVTAQRVAWELEKGQEPTEAVLHHCDNPPCCNPAHLFLGSQQANMADMWAKGRGQRGETHYKAKLSADDVRSIREQHARGVKLFELAKQFGVHRMTIKYAVTRGWKGVA